MLSSDDTQEIDICEAYGSSRWTNEWFSNKRLHLSHHVFIRSPFQDWQPNDAGSFYTDGTTIWSDGYHRIGVYWKDPWTLEYYVDGKLVRTRSGVNEIDPNGYTNGDGLSKPMDIIINTEDQTWRAVQGLSPTAAEIAQTEDHTFKVDWLRVYKPIDGEVGPVTGVSLNNSAIDLNVGGTFDLVAIVEPTNALDRSVTWESDNPSIAIVNTGGMVQGISEGIANIIVTTNDGHKKDTCTVTVTDGVVEQSIELDEESKYLNAVYKVDGELTVTCNFHAGTGNTVVDGVKFWLREIEPGWSVANDYIAFDYSVAGKTSGTATASISLENVPATSEIPSDNWYFLFLTFTNSEGTSVNKGIYPIRIVRTTGIGYVAEGGMLKVYPNPVQNNMQVHSVEKMTQLVIYNLGGGVQLIKSLNSNNDIIYLENLDAGLYILKAMTSKGEWFSQKIIKQ